MTYIKRSVLYKKWTRKKQTWEEQQRLLRNVSSNHFKQRNQPILKDSRWALCNESNEEVHVVNEGVVVGAGQVFVLMFIGSSSVVVHEDDTILHTSNVSQILWQGLGIKGVFSVLWRSCEDWWTDAKVECYQVFLLMKSIGIRDQVKKVFRDFWVFFKPIIEQ